MLAERRAGAALARALGGERCAAGRGGWASMGVRAGGGVDGFVPLGIDDLYVELQGRCFGWEALAVVAGLIPHLAVDALGAEHGRCWNAHLGRNLEAFRIDAELVMTRKGQRQLFGLGV